MDSTRTSRGPTPADVSPSRPDTVNVLGVKVTVLNLDTATAHLQQAIAERRKGYVCVAGAHGLTLCQDDAQLRSIFNRALLVTPDGMPLVWALKRAGHAESGRVYGPDLMLSLIEGGVQQGLRHFLYGAVPETLDRLKARLLGRFPGAQIAGTYAPPFRDLTSDEEHDIAEVINRSEADVVWVGLSTPKQERWMARMRDQLDAPILLGVGAAFDFHAGNKRQAPAYLQRHGLEWAFRLCTEPRRLWRRYAVAVPSYIALDTMQRLGLRQFPLEGESHGGAPGWSAQLPLASSESGALGGDTASRPKE